MAIAHGAEPLGAMDRAEMWARQAIRLDERSSQGWYVLSRLESMRPNGSSAKSLEYALKAATFNPLNHYARISLAVTLAGASCELGAAVYLKSPQVNPLDLNSPSAAAGLLHQMGRSSEALSLLDRVLGIEPDLPYPLLMKTTILIARGEPAAAADVFRRLEGVTEGPFPPQALEMVQDFLELSRSAGPGDQASRSVARVMQLARGEGLQFPYWERATQVVAPLLARMDYPAEALETLEARTRLGIVEPYDMLLWNPELGPLRQQSRFAPVLEAARAHFDEMLTILEAARSRGELPDYLDQAMTELINRLPD
jgi:tetratricopeptide (TPR) repeat protein